VETALRRMGEMIEATTSAVRDWFAAGGVIDPVDPGTWPVGLWLLLAAFVVLLFAATVRRRARAPLDVRPPDILITQGELVPEARPGRVGSGLLTMTVSNLGRYPVQLLEAANRSGGGRFGVADVVALVPAMGEVDVEVHLPVGKLEDGVLDLFCYAAATRTKTWRHRAELVWEPWAKRFKVAPLEQRIEPAKALASSRRDVVRMDDVRKAVEAVAQQAATVASHAEAKRSEIMPRAVEAVTPRRTAVREDASRVVPAARAGEGGPSDGAEARGPLAALLGNKRATAVTPPQAPPGGGAGASARAARTPGSAATTKRGPTTTVVPVTGPTGGGPSADRPADRAGDRPGDRPADRPADREGSRTGDGQVPAHPVTPGGRAPTLDGRPTPAAADPDADEDAAPKRPRDRVLEFPDDF